MVSNKSVLIVEDNKSDAQMIVSILKEMNIGNVFVANDGSLALEFVCGNASSSFIPDLIILDLNMMKMTGHEFLRKLRKDKTWNVVPVVIFTTSSNQEEIDIMLSTLQANSYLVKPGDYKKFRDCIRKTTDYYLNIAESGTKPSLFQIKTQELS